MRLRDLDKEIKQIKKKKGWEKIKVIVISDNAPNKMYKIKKYVVAEHWNTIKNRYDAVLFIGTDLSKEDK